MPFTSGITTWCYVDVLHFNMDYAFSLLLVLSIFINYKRPLWRCAPQVSLGHTQSHGATSFLTSYHFFSQSRNSSRLFIPERSLPSPKQRATCHYPESHHSSPRFHPTSWKPILISSPHLRLGFSIVLFHCYPHQDPKAHLYPIRATCPVHLIRLLMSTQILFGEE